MNQALRDHVTSIGFNLTLSKSMIRILSSTYYQECWRDKMPSGMSVETPHIAARNHPLLNSDLSTGHFITSERALTARGLMYRQPFANPKRGSKPKLTKAGLYVCMLLQEAGLLVPLFAENDDDATPVKAEGGE